MRKWWLLLTKNVVRYRIKSACERRVDIKNHNNGITNHSASPFANLHILIFIFVLGFFPHLHLHHLHLHLYLHLLLHFFFTVLKYNFFSGRHSVHASVRLGDCIIILCTKIRIVLAMRHNCINIHMPCHVMPYSTPCILYTNLYKWFLVPTMRRKNKARRKKKRENRRKRKNWCINRHFPSNFMCSAPMKFRLTLCFEGFRARAHGLHNDIYVQCCWYRARDLRPTRIILLTIPKPNWDDSDWGILPRGK